MKRYEQLKIDLTTKEGFTKALHLKCGEIKDGISEGNCVKPMYNFFTCLECKAERLFAEVLVKKVRRGDTYGGDFAKAKDDWDKMCKANDVSCGKCEYHYHSWAHNTAGCFTYWLMEEIEVEE